MYRFLLAASILLLSSCKSHRISNLFYAGEIQAQDFLEEIPFDLVNGLIVLQVNIQGEKYRMIFDTGAPNLISKELADELDLSIILKSRVTDSQGNAQALPYSKLDSIKIGNLLFEDFGVIIADWSNVPQLVCFEIDGLIGANLMRRAYWQVDYEQKVLRVSNELEKFQLPADTISIPFTTTTQGTPHVDMEIGDLKFNNLTLDLGSNKDISFSRGMLRKLQKEHNVNSTWGLGYGSAGLYGQVKDTIRQFVLPEFTMNSNLFSPMVVTATGGGNGAVGNGFFKNFLVTLDWEQNMVYLSRPKELSQTEFHSYGLSFSFVDNQFQVGFIYNNSPAERAELKLGQRILRLEKYDFSEETLDTYCAFFMNRDELYEKTEIRLEVDDSKGGTRVVILQKENLLALDPG